MAPDSQPAPPPPRRTLADLPPELKGMIARMARDQDLAYEARRIRGYFPMPVLSGINEWDGRSAHALSLADRSWHSAVAPVLFETITSERCRKNLFGFRIVPRFGRSVKKVSFEDDSKDADWKALFRALPLFITLEHVKFDEQPGIALFNTSGQPDSEQATCREALGMVAPSISSLELQMTVPDALVWMLPLFINLRRLEWSVYVEYDVATDLRPAALALARCSKLEHLTLELMTEAMFAELVKVGVGPSLSPSLRSLHLDHDLGMQFGKDAWNFIRSFKDTVETVRLGFSCHRLSNDVWEESDKPPSPFPKLQRLTIKVGLGNTDITPLLKLFSASPICHLSLSVFGDGFGDSSGTARDALPSTSLLETILRLYPTYLQSVHLDYRPFTNAAHLHSLAPTLSSLASTRNVFLTLNPSYDVFQHPSTSRLAYSVPPLNLNQSCHDIEDVLKFGSEQAAGFRMTKDAFAMERLIKALEPLKASMMRARD
ncbi:hypothetical protein BCR35DRAFT_309792 [Leucosporidium creatinivorum]|uniref:F-box domain-containing protein n=1 Tax=Leucosporidium creatinivorum TaxID=106004 RepID=A0A1Y2DCY2_9BASI|nr:hypothetical protein BCR35DRAFT_309792 [Leucosporidium creatinivorum]